MQYFLEFETGNRLKMCGPTIELGRSRAVDESLRKRSISRRHALLWYVKTEGWWIRNVSDSPLTVNGEEVEVVGQLLNSEDVICLSDAVDIKFLFDVEGTYPGDESGEDSDPMDTLALPSIQEVRGGAMRELVARVEKTEAAIALVCQRQEAGEQFDERTRRTLEDLTRQLRQSSVKFDRFSKQLGHAMGLGLGAIGFSLLTALGAGVIKDTQRTHDFLAALLDEVGDTEGAVQLVIGMGSAVIAGRRWHEERKAKQAKHRPAQPLPCRRTPIHYGPAEDMETNDGLPTDIQTRHPEPRRYPTPRA